MLTFKVTGDGWAKFGGRAQPVKDQLQHSERWQRGLVKNKQHGLMINVIVKRKNKRDFPELEPIPIKE